MRRHRDTTRGRLLPFACAALLAPGVPLVAGDPRPKPAEADLTTLPLEELMEIPLVVAAARRPQRQREAAAPVTVITADEVDLLGHRNLADVLRNQRGFYLFSDGLNNFVGVRGFLRPGEWNARVLVLVDGRPTRDPLYGQTHVEQDFLFPIEAAKTVEVVRGPGSALYGSNAVFSVINVNTFDGADLNGGFARVTGGTEETARAVAMYGFRTADGWDVIGGAAGYVSQGDESITYEDIGGFYYNYGTIHDNDYEGAATGFLKVKKGDFSAAVDLSRRNRDNRSALYYADFRRPGSMHEERDNVTLRFDHEISPGQSFHAMAWYGRYVYRQPTPYPYDPETGNPAYTYTSTGFSEWLGQEAHYAWQVDERLHLLAGFDAMQTIHTHQLDDDGSDVRPVDVIDSAGTVGVFGELEYKAAGWLTLLAGARFDRVQDVGNHFSPRVAAIVHPTKADTVKLLYGRSFRAPNIFERTYDAGGDYAANPRLESEIIDTFEVVHEREWDDGWRTSVGGFYWVMDDALRDVTLDDGRLQVQNVDRVGARGVEAELSKRWSNHGLFRVYGSYQRAEDDETGARLIVSPEWIAGASAVIPLFGKDTFLAIDPQIVGPMESDLGDETDATFVTHVNFTARNLFGVRNLQFQLSVHNLFADDARWPHGDANLHAQPYLNWPETRVTANLSYRF